MLTCFLDRIVTLSPKLFASSRSASSLIFLIRSKPRTFRGLRQRKDSLLRRHVLWSLVTHHDISFVPVTIDHIQDGYAITRQLRSEQHRSDWPQQPPLPKKITSPFVVSTTPRQESNLEFCAKKKRWKISTLIYLNQSHLFTNELCRTKVAMRGARYGSAKKRRRRHTQNIVLHDRDKLEVCV